MVAIICPIIAIVFAAASAHAAVPFSALSSALNSYAAQVTSFSSAIFAYPTTSIPAAQGSALASAIINDAQDILVAVSDANVNAASVTPCPLLPSQGSYLASLLVTNIQPVYSSAISRLVVLKPSLATIASSVTSVVSAEVFFQAFIQQSISSQLQSIAPTQFSSSISSANYAIESVLVSAYAVYYTPAPKV